MIPRRIQGATHWLGAPRNWKPDQDGDCGHLPIRTQGDPRIGHGYCESAWEPTPKELEALNAGGSIVLRVMGWQPPVALYVEKPPKDQGTEAAPDVQTDPEPADPAAISTAPDIRQVKVCPMCEEPVSPLSLLCQTPGCPVRGTYTQKR